MGTRLTCWKCDHANMGDVVTLGKVEWRVQRQRNLVTVHISFWRK
jgi:hypothetical protein